MPTDDAFAPDPWVMGVVTIGVGLVLWWLVPDLAREDERISRILLGRLSPSRRWPRAMRSIRHLWLRGFAALMVVLGVLILIVAA